MIEQVAHQSVIWLRFEDLCERPIAENPGISYILPRFSLIFCPHLASRVILPPNKHKWHTLFEQEKVHYKWTRWDRPGLSAHRTTFGWGGNRANAPPKLPAMSRRTVECTVLRLGLQSIGYRVLCIYHSQYPFSVSDSTCRTAGLGLLYKLLHKQPMQLQRSQTSLNAFLIQHISGIFSESLPNSSRTTPRKICIPMNKEPSEALVRPASSHLGSPPSLSPASLSTPG